MEVFANLSILQIAAVTALLFLIVKWTTINKYKLPPGPYPLPLLGNLLSFKGVSLWSIFDEWSKKFGPVVTFYVGPKRIILINNYEVLSEAYIKQGSDFAGKPNFYTLSLFSEGNKSISLGQYGDLWKYQRRLATHALRQYLTGTQLENRVHEALQTVITAFKSEKGAFCPHRHLSLSVFNIMHGLCFGNLMSLDDPAFIRFMNTSDTFLENIDSWFIEDFFPPLRLWPTKRFRETMKEVDAINSYFHKQYEDHKANFNPDQVESLSDSIILAVEQTLKEENPNVSAQFTETHEVQIIADVFGAGVDTTRATLIWFFLVVAAYPEVQEGIQKEIDAVVGNEIPGKEHRSKLVYLEAVLLETMRLYYVVPIGLPHETLRDTTIGGFEIPAKTVTVVNNRAIMRDATDWDEPEAFKPERFLDETASKLKTKHKSWVPFSLGHRSCPGESLARLDLVYIIAGLLQVLSFSLPPGAKADFSSYNPGINNFPNPYKVIVTSRDFSK